MTDYSKTVDFATKDTLPSGNAGKVVKGTEINTELANVATHVATKSNKVLSATNNNLLAMDANGDLKDSTLTTDGSGKVTNFKGEVHADDGTLVLDNGTDGSDATFTGDVIGNADTVTTNANMTGDVTSVGNATTIAAGAVETAMLESGEQMTTANVNGVIASSSAGAIGTYAMLMYTLSGTNAGVSRTGNLVYSDANNNSGLSASGTWQAMGDSGGANQATLWLRVS